MKLLRFLSVILLVSFGWSATATGAEIDELAERLRNGSDFRVRVQAALELGKTRDRAARRHLEAALGDENAAVRASAAAGLKVLGDPEAIRELRKHRKDKSPAVQRAVQATIEALEEAKSKSERPRVRVTLGKMTNGSKTGPRLTKQLATTSKQKFAELPGVVVGEAAGKLPEVMVSGRVSTLVGRKEGSQMVVTAKVEFIMHAMPGRTIRGKISGSATARTEASEVKSKKQLARLRREVLAAAIASAMRRAPEALDAAATQ